MCFLGCGKKNETHQGLDSQIIEVFLLINSTFTNPTDSPHSPFTEAHGTKFTEETPKAFLCRQGFTSDPVNRVDRPVGTATGVFWGEPFWGSINLLGMVISNPYCIFKILYSQLASSPQVVVKINIVC